MDKRLVLKSGKINLYFSCLLRKQSLTLFIFIDFSPEKDTEVYADNRSSTYECLWTFKRQEACLMNALAEYQNERRFFAQLKPGECANYSEFKTTLIRFYFVKPRNCVFNISEITVAHRQKPECWIRMEPGFENQQDKEVRIFTARMNTNVSSQYAYTFRVKIVSTIENYCFVDTHWISDLWSRKQLTDVDILVGQNKLRAHKIVLSARSPVLKTLLSKISNTGEATCTISDKDEDSSIVEHFLKYLYTGTLEISANNKQLLALAEKYQVETLKKICLLAVESSNVDDITASLLLNLSV